MSYVPAYTDRAVGGMSTRYARWPGGVLRQGGTEGGLAAAVEGECRAAPGGVATRTATPDGPPRARSRVGRTVSVLTVSGPGEEVLGAGVSVRADMSSVCIYQGEAAGQPTDPALTSATLGTGGVGWSGAAVR
jgi:hypothetical protein